MRSVTRYPDSRPEKLRAWGAISLWLGATLCVTNAGVFALVRAGAGPLPFLSVDLLTVALLALTCWWFVGRRGHPLGPRGRQLLGLTLVTTLGAMAVAWVRLPQALADAAGARLTAYPSIMVMYAVHYALQGRLWVGFYLIGGLFLTGAFAVGVWPQAGPLSYAALAGAVSSSLGLFLRLQARRAERAPRPAADVS
jgi:hypothetical protein